ncbi:MAG: glutamyl-tRNA synthetase [Clostridiaceae bacterium BRH_c20a]|nr:MAG: glutamyl-tRNA synthetase [Clostridiaceae bacterium BRH_c20a]
MENIKVRFAPSPTGPLHIGGARSALFNYLLARRLGGKMVLRIEDTDLERSSRESELNIYESLKWLGIDWDEGPDVGGSFGPYRQTERLDLYTKYAQVLIEKGLAYLCYCSEEELEEQRQAFTAKGELPRYSGCCRKLTKGQEEKYVNEGRKPVIRFKVPDNQPVVIDDLVRGTVIFESSGIGDYVIIKSDGIPTYNFAAVVDDYLMKITHVIRAEEHLSNTPRQVLIYEALDWGKPKFAHISLILGKDKSKMSKRHGATSVVQYKEQGYLPEAVVNFLVLLGWSSGGEEEIFTMEQLIEQFSLDRVAKNPAVFDMDKLKWINGYYIRQSPAKEIVKLALPFLREAGYLPQDINEEQYRWVEMIVTSIQEKIHCVNEVLDYMKIFVGVEVEFENEETRLVLTEEQVPQVIEALRTKLKEMDIIEPEAVKKALKAITKETKLGGRNVFMPIRVALTGQMHGPELHYIIPVLGTELVEKRVEYTLEKANSR